MSQGQGAGTHRKQERFFHAAALGMKIFVGNPKFAGFPFWLFDGNCGSGTNHDVGVMGSPMVAHLAADEARLPEERRRFFFCDRDPARMAELQLLFREGYPRLELCSYLLPGDNEGALLTFAERIRATERSHYAIGLVIVDPNGWFHRGRNGNGPPTDTLVEFAREFERIDILLNLNFFTYQRMRGHGWPVLSPIEVLSSLHRKHWLVGRIMVANSRFLVAIGRNTPTGDHQKIKMFHLESENGRGIIDDIDGKGQADIFSTLPKLPGISGSSSLSRGSESGVESD